MLIGVVLLAKNEEQIIGEWLAFYRAHGFDRIHVFDNDSTDNTVEILKQASHTFGGITYERWPTDRHFNDVQIGAYNRGLEIMRADEVEWCLFIDADEFLVCTEGHTVRDLLARRDAHAAIALHWAFFGSAGYTEDPQELTIESFVWRAPASFEAQKLCKSFVRVPYVQGCIDPHKFMLDAVHFPYVDCNGNPVQWESIGQDHVIWPWRIHHYFVRSKVWWRKKIERTIDVVGFDRMAHEWDHYDRNEEFDPTATKYGDAVREEIARLGLTPPPKPQHSFGAHFMDYCVRRGVYLNYFKV